MKIIRNNIFPFPGYKAVNIFGILFVRKKAKINDSLINHESIHSEQMKELLWIFFYVWYGIEWLIKLIKYRSAHKAYKHIGFEKEAYIYEDTEDYLKNRRHYAWFKMI